MHISKTLLAISVIAAVMAFGASAQAGSDEGDRNVVSGNVFANGWSPAHALLVRDVISHFDVNQNGVIVFGEYVQGVRRTFAKWDVRGDGVLQQEEIPKALERAITQVMDLNGDGFITQYEYRTTMAQIAYAIDRNADARLTYAEIGRSVYWARLPSPEALTAPQQENGAAPRGGRTRR